MTRINGFSITYEIITHESAEEGDAADEGFVVENVTLGEALSHISTPLTPSRHPFDPSHPYTWFNTIDADVDYRTGDGEHRALHLPRNLTTSTRQRIARLVGAI